MADARILYSESLVQSWELSLRSAFAEPYVRLTRRSSKAVGRFSVAVDAGDQSYQANDAEYPQQVIEVRGRGIPPETFWVAFKANFDFWRQGQHLLEHASIALFQQLSAGDLIPMFRAEWDSRAALDQTSGHAQPHWHFVQSGDQIRTMLLKPPLNTPEAYDFSSKLDPTIPENVSELLDFSGFHFAMSPFWGAGTSPSYKQVFESDASLNAWLRNLTLYIVNQLVYVSQEAGGVLFDKVREFASKNVNAEGGT